MTVRCTVAFSVVEFGWHDLWQVLLLLLTDVGALVKAARLLLVAHSVERLRAPHRHCFGVFALRLLLNRS